MRPVPAKGRAVWHSPVPLLVQRLAGDLWTIRRGAVQGVLAAPENTNPSTMGSAGKGTTYAPGNVFPDLAWPRRAR